MSEPYTYADRLAELRAREAALKVERLAAWRAAHPEATCSDRTALALAEIAAMVGKLAS